MPVRKKSKKKSKAKQKVQEIDYRHSIRKVQKRVHPTLSITPKAVFLTSTALNFANAEIISECLKSFKSKKKDKEIKADAAEKAVKKFCKGDIQHHAIAAGQTSVLKFHTNLLSYNLKFNKLRIKIPAKLSKKPWGVDFGKGLENLVQMTQSTARMDQKAKRNIGSFLDRFISRMAHKMSESQVVKMTSSDVQTATENVLPPIMAEHAKSEGQKMIFLAENQNITYVIPPKRRKKNSHQSSQHEQEKKRENADSSGRP